MNSLPNSSHSSRLSDLPKTSQSSQPSTSQSRYIVLNYKTSSIDYTDNKKLQNTIDNIKKFIDEKKTVLSQDTLEALKAHIKSQTLNERVQQLGKNSKLFLNLLNFMQNMAKKFASLIFKSINFIQDRQGIKESLARQIITQIENQLVINQIKEKIPNH